jgi:hypothetical protein
MLLTVPMAIGNPRKGRKEILENVPDLKSVWHLDKREI